MYSPEKTESTLSNSALIDALQQIIPAGSLLFEEEDLKPYECDGLSAYRAIPLAVVLPETIEQVQQVLILCHEHQVPVVARGAGTGLSGGALPHEQGVLLSLARGTSGPSSSSSGHIEMPNVIACSRRLLGTSSPA